VLPQSIDNHDIKTLSLGIEQTMAAWQSLMFQASASPQPADQP
jgi:hypothetical protein